MKYKSIIILFVVLITVASSVKAEKLHHNRPVVAIQFYIWDNYLDNLYIELYPQDAPITVDNFLYYANSGFYELTLFHRVIQGFMIQGGGYTYTNTGWDNNYCLWLQKKATLPPIINESYNGLLNERGTVAMAMTDQPNSATSQFFINQVHNRHLDPNDQTGDAGYCVFGRVARGMELVDFIATVPTYGYDPDDQRACADFNDLPQYGINVRNVTTLPCHYSHCMDYIPDGVIDFADMAAFAQSWGASDCNSANFFCSDADLNFDGSVGLYDLFLFMNQWLAAVGSEAVLSDYSGNGTVDFQDYAFIADHWLDDNCDPDNVFCNGTDLNQDGIVDFDDLELFFMNWLETIE